MSKLILPPGFRRVVKEALGNQLEGRPYRGSDNPKAHRRQLSATPVVLVPREELGKRDRPALLPGRKSRRPRRNVWVPA